MVNSSDIHTTLKLIPFDDERIETTVVLAIFLSCSARVTFSKTRFLVQLSSPLSHLVFSLFSFSINQLLCVRSSWVTKEIIEWPCDRHSTALFYPNPKRAFRSRWMQNRNEHKSVCTAVIVHLELLLRRSRNSFEWNKLLSALVSCLTNFT